MLQCPQWIVPQRVLEWSKYDRQMTEPYAISSRKDTNCDFPVYAGNQHLHYFRHGNTTDHPLLGGLYLLSDADSHGGRIRSQVHPSTNFVLDVSRNPKKTFDLEHSGVFRSSRNAHQCHSSPGGCVDYVRLISTLARPRREVLLPPGETEEGYLSEQQ